MKKSLLPVFGLMALTSVAFAAIDINTASEKDLSAVKGVGPTKAKSIVQYRMEHGNFKNIKGLEKVPGFSAKTVAKLSKDLTVSESATPTPAPAQTTTTTTPRK